MPDIHLPRPTRGRLRLIATTAVLGATAAVVVISNQPSSHPPSTPPSAVRAAAAASPRVPAAAASAASPTPQPPTPLAVLHGGVAFTDRSAGFLGAPPIRTDTGILVDVDTGAILWENDPHQPHLAASTFTGPTSRVALGSFDAHRHVTMP